ncbi:MAG: hypothetical protein JWO58_2773 [Chitinophagaceae bacterium]|nr:hypothetical protein [Chitinophagaceae bacterium]
MKKLFTYSLLVALFSSLLLSSCKKTDYPCPGLGQSDAADISQFDENGQLKEESGKKKKSKKNTVGRFDANTGLIDKKKPARLNKPQKTKLY